MDTLNVIAQQEGVSFAVLGEDIFPLDLGAAELAAQPLVGLRATHAHVQWINGQRGASAPASPTMRMRCASQMHTSVAPTASHPTTP